jgi:hypothetical protein
MNGTLDILNCGAGHLKFSFDGSDPLEIEKAKRVIEDMLRRGYALFVEVDGELHKAEGFDPETTSYIISEGADPSAKRKGRKRKVPAGSARATGVGPTSGG